MLGSEAIVDRYNQALSAGAKVPAHAVVGVEAAKDEAAAVKEHEERIGTWRPRAVGPQDYRATWPLHCALAHIAHRCRRGDQAFAGLVLCARIRDRECVRRRDSRSLVKQRLDLRSYRYLLSFLYSGGGLIWTSYDSYVYRAAMVPDRGIKREHGAAGWATPWPPRNSQRGAKRHSSHWATGKAV